MWKHRIKDSALAGVASPAPELFLVRRDTQMMSVLSSGALMGVRGGQRRTPKSKS